MGRCLLVARGHPQKNQSSCDVKEVWYVGMWRTSWWQGVGGHCYLVALMQTKIWQSSVVTAAVRAALWDAMANTISGKITMPTALDAQTKSIMGQKYTENMHLVIMSYINRKVFNLDETHMGDGDPETRYLRVIQLSKSSARAGQQEIAAQDGHFIAKLHVLQWAVWNCPLLQIDYSTVHEEGRVDQFCDFCQVPLTETETEQDRLI